VVVEVKTSDAYRVDTARIAGYRKQLIAQNQIREDSSSELLIVGRQDTGELEAQIRGSRYAWEIRVISIDALLRLMKLKETLDDPATIRRICEILIPREYTRLDEIVDLVFSATEEAQQEEPEIDQGEGTLLATTPARNGVKPAAFYDACIAKVNRQQQLTLIRQSRSTYASPDGSARAVCVVSKEHSGHGRTESYWFAFHPHQNEFLSAGNQSMLILGCGTPERVLAIPYGIVKSWLDDLWTTQRENGESYWHIRLHRNGDHLSLDRKKGKGRLDVNAYRVS